MNNKLTITEKIVCWFVVIFGGLIWLTALFLGYIIGKGIDYIKSLIRL